MRRVSRARAGAGSWYRRRPSPEGAQDVPALTRFERARERRGFSKPGSFVRLAHQEFGDVFRCVGEDFAPPLPQRCAATAALEPLVELSPRSVKDIWIDEELCRNCRMERQATLVVGDDGVGGSRGTPHDLGYHPD